MEIRKFDHWATRLLFLVVAVCFLSKCKKDEKDDEAPDSGLNAHIMVWTSSYLNYNAPITVICNGQTKEITLYQYNSVPECNAGGCANFDLGPGTYPIYAYHDSTVWVDTVIVGEAQCLRLNIDSLPSTVNQQNSALMAGTYSGIGQFLPGQIELGTSPDCITVPYGSNVLQGTSTLHIGAVSPDEINIICTCDAFPPIIFQNVFLEREGDIISFDGGTYDLQSHLFSYSGGTPNSTYMTTDACLVQLPQVYGWNPDGAGFTYWTIEHLVFAGYKDE